MKEKKMITKINLQTYKLVFNQHIFFFLGEIKKPHLKKKLYKCTKKNHHTKEVYMYNCKRS